MSNRLFFLKLAWIVPGKGWIYDKGIFPEMPIKPKALACILNKDDRSKMIFAWLKQQRRRKIIETPFPPEWLPHLQRNVPHFHLLKEAERKLLCDGLRILIEEKNWEGCAGLELTDEIKVTIAGQACLLLLGLTHNYYERTKSILVYPGAWQIDKVIKVGEGVGIETKGADLGEAWYRGPVILSWADIVPGGQPRGHNLVLHEFAHQLDFLDGVPNGTPPLKHRNQYRKWNEVMTAEFQRLQKEASRGMPTLLDPYGTTNETEFFAVATECFFELPVELASQHPALYDLLREYYCQDPRMRHF